jgi:hypothetical protein
MAKKDYELTEGEWAILTTIWENEPCAAPSVQEDLAGRKNWTYSTVKTMMDKGIAQKGTNPKSFPVPLSNNEKTGAERRNNAHCKKSF